MYLNLELGVLYILPALIFCKAANTYITVLISYTGISYHLHKLFDLPCKGTVILTWVGILSYHHSTQISFHKLFQSVIQLCSYISGFWCSKHQWSHWVGALFPRVSPLWWKQSTETVVVCTENHGPLSQPPSVYRGRKTQGEMEDGVLYLYLSPLVINPCTVLYYVTCTGYIYIYICLYLCLGIYVY